MYKVTSINAYLLMNYSKFKAGSCTTYVVFAIAVSIVLLKHILDKAPHLRFNLIHVDQCDFMLYV